MRHHQPYTDIIEHESDIHTVINPEQQVTGPSETEVPETSQSHLKDEPPSVNMILLYCFIYLIILLTFLLLFIVGKVCYI